MLLNEKFISKNFPLYELYDEYNFGITYLKIFSL